MLTANEISKSFAGVHALKNVSLDIRPNEVVGLIGENGAGKSTLMRILAGTHQPDGGTLMLDGQPLKLRNARDGAAHGIGMVFQEQSLLLNLSVAENIYLGQEDQFVRFGVMNWTRMRAAAKRQLAKIGVDIDVTARTSELTFAARQMVELAKALTLEETVSRPLVILLDEHPARCRSWAWSRPQAGRGAKPHRAHFGDGHARNAGQRRYAARDARGSAHIAEIWPVPCDGLVKNHRGLDSPATIESLCERYMAVEPGRSAMLPPGRYRGWAARHYPLVKNDLLAPHAAGHAALHRHRRAGGAAQRGGS